jgi:hypothetical protein
MSFKKRVAAFAATGLVLGLAQFVPGVANANTPVTGAAFTSVNEGVDGTGHCQNGNPNTNCNIYDGKQYVWLNGGPSTAYVGDGDYFFAVLAPGGQSNPNDGAADNLSDDVDAYTNRTFSVSGGTVSYSGGHDSDSNKIRLFDYADTPNPGGVYILAICSLADGYPVNASDCKYDAFKVNEGTVVQGQDLTIVKDANGDYDNAYTWTITKDVDKTTVKQVGGSATFNYTVKVTHDGGTISNVKVTGTISVFNPNVDGNGDPVPVDIDGVSDHLTDSNSTVCSVTDGGAQTLTKAQTDFAYECDLGAVPDQDVQNVATVEWSTQFLDNGALLDGNSASVTFPKTGGVSFTENAIDECVVVKDTFGLSGQTGTSVTLGTACVGDDPAFAKDAGNNLSNFAESYTSPTFTFTYSRSIAIPANGCLSYDNTAKFTTTDNGVTGSAGQTVTVCGPAKTGALTIGFWKTTNGQSLIGTYCQASGGTTALGSYLATLGAEDQGPFKDAGSVTTCANLKTYVYNILNGATATDMNKMLKAQMLGTALDVWFSGPGWTSTKIGSAKPPSNFLSHNSLGNFKMDTTAVCPMVDNLNTGSATCKNNTPSTDAVAAGAVPSSPMKMQDILDFAATWTTDGGAFIQNSSPNAWYGQPSTGSYRTKQEILKNIFDQFNNQLAFGSF